jgi:hypothetical protein
MLRNREILHATFILIVHGFEINVSHNAMKRGNGEWQSRKVNAILPAPPRK